MLLLLAGWCKSSKVVIERSKEGAKRRKVVFPPAIYHINRPGCTPNLKGSELKT